MPQAGPWCPRMIWGLPPLHLSYDGHPDQLAMFLSHAIGHLDKYAPAYLSQWAMVMAVIAALQGEAVAWAADLYSDHARELGDVGLFLDALQAQFEDVARVQRAESEVVGLQQHGRPVVDYVHEFRWVASRLRLWPEQMLVHHFKVGLDGALRRACVVRGIPHLLQEWFQVAVELDVGLRDSRGRIENMSWGRRSIESAREEK